MVNRGKQFEEQIQTAFEKLKDTCIVRLYDVTNGYIGINNPCDYIAYKKPTIYFIECKSTHENTLNFKSDIRENQWEGLLNLSKTNGVVAGYMVWFIKADKTVFVSAETMKRLKDEGQKSLNVNKLPNDHIIINGIKRRILFDYDLTSFIEQTSKN